MQERENKKKLTGHANEDNLYNCRKSRNEDETEEEEEAKKNNRNKDHPWPASETRGLGGLLASDGAARPRLWSLIMRYNGRETASV